MTADYVAFHAAERPDAVAVVSNGRAISYSELSRDIRSISRAVRALGLSHGRSAAVGCDDLYMHWLLLLACEQLGVATASFLSSGAAPKLASMDMVLTEPHFPTGAARRHHSLTADWIQSALACSDGAEETTRVKAADDPIRIVHTSGTTGPSKRFLVLRRMHDARSAQWIWSFNLTRLSRYLVSLPMFMRGTYDCGCACLRVGGTIVLESRMTTVEVLCTHPVTHIILLPIHLRAMLDELPPGFAKPRDFTIVTFGGGVSPALRERATERLATAVYETYGTAEACTISTISGPDTGGFGTIPPRTEVEVIDERGDPLPMGSMGRVRVRTEVMCEGYLDDPETTQRMFRDGWFYPGDLGILQMGRRLKILGRADDLLNIGGQKFLPTLFEELLLRAQIVGDVGVCSVDGADGIDRLCVAVSEFGPDADLLRRITEALQGYQIGPFHIVKLARIPRNANGKIDRARLKAEALSFFGPGR